MLHASIWHRRRRGSRRRLHLDGILLLLALLGCGAPESLPPAQILSTPQLRVTKLTEGFAFGVKMALLDDGRILLTEKETGFVRLVNAAFELQSQPVVDVAVNYASERGLLGIAVHPQFSRTGYVYLAYVASSTASDTNTKDEVNDIRIARFRLTDTTTETPPRTIISLPATPGPYHNGGSIRFGPDDKLYVSLGELNRHANINSQLTGNRRGKLLRYNDDGTIPPDNPLGPRNPVYIYGIRNSFGFAFDTDGQSVLVSDNGPKGNDRLVRALPGENLGWPLVWGVADRWYERLAEWWLGKRFRPALWESFQVHAVPTAVQVLPNDLYGPKLTGRVLMSTFGQGSVLQFALDEATRSAVIGTGTFLEGFPHLVDMQLDSAGRLYLLTITALYRVDPVPRAAR